jgi:hypothetical protein
VYRATGGEGEGQPSTSWHTAHQPGIADESADVLSIATRKFECRPTNNGEEWNTNSKLVQSSRICTCISNPPVSRRRPEGGGARKPFVRPLLLQASKNTFTKRFRQSSEANF